MNESDCGAIRALIPEVASGRAGWAEARGVRAHASGCVECRSELRVSQAVFAGRAHAPPELLERLQGAVRGLPVSALAQRGPARRAGWAVSAAAAAALAIGIGVVPAPPAAVVAPAYASETTEGEVWASDDATVAGAPMFDELSDEALLALLDELAAEPEVSR